MQPVNTTIGTFIHAVVMAAFNSLFMCVSHDASTVASVVSKLNRRQVLLTRSNAVANFFSVQSLGQSSRGNFPYFWRYPNFLRLITQCRIGRGKLPCQNHLDQSNRFDTVSACDGRRKEQTQRHSYRASTASCGKNALQL